MKVQLDSLAWKISIHQMVSLKKMCQDHDYFLHFILNCCIVIRFRGETASNMISDDNVFLSHFESVSTASHILLAFSYSVQYIVDNRLNDCLSRPFRFV